MVPHHFAKFALVSLVALGRGNSKGADEARPNLRPQTYPTVTYSRLDTKVSQELTLDTGQQRVSPGKDEAMYNMNFAADESESSVVEMLTFLNGLLRPNSLPSLATGSLSRRVRRLLRRHRRNFRTSSRTTPR